VSGCVHLNCGWLHAPPLPPACCHCLLYRSDSRVLLVDTGIGLQDIAAPQERIGREAIDAAGFLFIESLTAVRQLERMGIRREQVTDIVLTHCDPDHAGGLSDFPEASVHLAAEEMSNVASGNPRYSPAQFSHEPRWVACESDDSEVFGLPARRVETASGHEVRLVPLFGHTLGHCGVAVKTGDVWMQHAGDAYYLRDELTNPEHPVSQLARMRADDDAARLESLGKLRSLVSSGVEGFRCLGYHDSDELPPEVPGLADVLGREV